MNNRTPWRRRLAATALALAVIGTGIASMATTTDNLTNTNSYSVLTADLKAAENGGTFSDAVTINWVLEGTTGVVKRLDLKNNGNASTSVTFTVSATGSASITGAKFQMRSESTGCPTIGVYPLDVPQTGAGSVNRTSQTTGTVAAAPQIGGTWTVAAGATTIICMIAQPSTAPLAVDAAVQTITYTASSNVS